MNVQLANFIALIITTIVFYFVAVALITLIGCYLIGVLKGDDYLYVNKILSLFNVYVE